MKSVTCYRRMPRPKLSPRPHSMTEPYQRVEPTPFSAPQQTESAPEAQASGHPPWLLPAFGVLALLAIIVLFALPRWVDREAPAGPTAAVTAPKASTDSTPAPSREQQSTEEAPSPFADAVAARARSEAQELLEELLDVQENLISRRGETWASEAMASIAAQAEAGDAAYRERDFDSAIASYTAALDQAVALEGELPARLAAQLDAIDAAIDNLDESAANEALALAELLEPGDAALDERRPRVAALPRIIAAMERAGVLEDDGELAAALAALDGALAEDSQHATVAAERERIAEALKQQRFNAAMSEGYAALDNGTFGRAQQRFEAAAALIPGSTEAAAALDELAVARTSATLNRLQRQGEQQLDDEAWDQAIATFEEAQAIDASLRFAREGIALARPRAEVDKQLDAILDKPGRLVDDAILREAQAALARARGLDRTGPKFADKIARVAEVLRVAETPRQVTLRSDGLTEVTVYKVARLGAFDSRSLTLRPGEYTAVGTRRGYRDVRVVFTVGPNSAGDIVIACSESI